MIKDWMERVPSFRRRKRKQSLIGLDLGSTAIKAVEMTMGEDGPVVTGVAMRDILPGEDFQDALAAMLAETYADDAWIRRVREVENPFGWGDAGRRIADAIDSFLNG